MTGWWVGVYGWVVGGGRGIWLGGGWGWGDMAGWWVRVGDMAGWGWWIWLGGGWGWGWGIIQEFCCRNVKCLGWTARCQHGVGEEG